jgi:hypothetical protein
MYEHDIHSFHSLACRLYPGIPVHTDRVLRQLLATPSPSTHAPYDVIVLDEAQDMCALHYELLRTHYQGKQLIVVGQIRQCVFEYKNDESTRADVTYLERPWVTMASLASTAEWKKMVLTTSFRLTQRTATFINHLFGLQGDDFIRGHIPGTHSVQYFCIDIWEHIKVASIVAAYIATFGADNVQIIAPFREKVDESDLTPATKIINYCSSHHKLFFLTKEDRGSGTRRYTMPGCKGTEADCVIVIGADSFATHVTDNQRMVACSRAIKQLVLCQSHTARPWREHSLEQIERLPGVEVHILTPPDPKNNRLPRDSCISVTTLCEHGVPSQTFRCVQEPRQPLTYVTCPWVTDTYGPNVCMLYGNACTVLAEQWHTKQTPSAYTAIFDPIPIGGGLQTFALQLLASSQETHGLVSRFVWDLQRHHSMRKKNLESRRWLQSHGLTTLREQDCLKSLQSLLCDHPAVVARLVTESVFQTNFPTSRLEDLCLSTPPLYTGIPWTAAQAVEATLAIDSFKGSHVRLNQIRDVSWVDSVVIEAAARHICHILPPTGVCFEQACCLPFAELVTYDNGFRKCKGIKGIIDAFHSDTNTIYEFKLSRERLQDMHKQQLLIYMHLWVAIGRYGEHTHVRGVLFNASTQERWRVEVPCSKEDSNAFLSCAVGLSLQTGDTISF